MQMSERFKIIILFLTLQELVVPNVRERNKESSIALLSVLLRNLLCNKIRKVYCTTQYFVYKTTAMVLKIAKSNLGNKTGFT